MAEDFKAMFVGIVVVSIFAMIGLIIHANVYDVAFEGVDFVNTSVTNETVTSVSLGADNQLANGARELACGLAFNASSGTLMGAANFSCSSFGFRLLSEDTAQNGSNVLLSYNYGANSNVHNTINNVNDTGLDAYELAIIGLLVLAAVLVLGIVMMMG